MAPHNFSKHGRLLIQPFPFSENWRGRHCKPEIWHCSGRVTFGVGRVDFGFEAKLGRVTWQFGRVGGGRVMLSKLRYIDDIHRIGALNYIFVDLFCWFVRSDI